MNRVEYSSNNSGGDWWLTDQDWKALEGAGWKVEWFADKPPSLFSMLDENGRWLGAMARNAYREGLSMAEAIEEWEIITGQSSNDLGCACCGSPHSFTEYGPGDEYIDSYSPSFPSQGTRYEA